MKCFLYIDNELIGTVDFKVIDESMGVISGDLVPSNNYRKFQIEVQQHFEAKGIANAEDFKFRITLADGTEIKSEGGIGIVDSGNVDEVIVEAAGVNLSMHANTAKRTK